VKTTDVIIVADVSGSMRHLEIKQRDAIFALLSQFADEEKAADPHVFLCAVMPFGSSVAAPTVFKPASSYLLGDLGNLSCTQGSTRLRDAVAIAIRAVGVRKPEAALIQVFTDGGENASGEAIQAVRDLYLTETAKDYLTVAVTGPREAGHAMAQIGLSADNFRMWDGQTERSYAETMQVTQTAASTYTATRRAGRRSTVKYYADPSQLTTQGVRGMTKKVEPEEVKTVSKHMDGRAIADFYKKFEKGRHYYQLVKPEYIDEGKDLVVHIKDTNEYRQGSRTVRMLLNLPEQGRLRVYPGPHSEKFDIYVQSASVNRKLAEGQKLLTL
jgi:hypothetical protein